MVGATRRGNLKNPLTAGAIQMGVLCWKSDLRQWLLTPLNDIVGPIRRKGRLDGRFRSEMFHSVLRTRVVTSIVSVLVGCALLLGINVGPANADRDGRQETFEFIFYYNSGWGGSWIDFAGSHYSLNGYNFITSGSGMGQAVKNNSGSVANCHPTALAQVWYLSNCAGIADTVYPNAKRDLYNTYNENASFCFIYDWEN